MIRINKDILNCCEQFEHKAFKIGFEYVTYLDEYTSLRISNDEEDILYVSIHDCSNKVLIFSEIEDGPLYLDYLKELYHILTKGKKYLTFKQ
jgi:hypothetical protein